MYFALAFSNLNGSFNNILNPSYGEANSTMIRYGSFFDWSNATESLTVSEDISTFKAMSSAADFNLLFIHIAELLIIDIVNPKTNVRNLSVPRCHRSFDPLCFGNSTLNFPAPDVINMATSFVDASFLYGTNETILSRIRLFQNGFLNLSLDMLPVSSIGFLAGDSRINRNAGTQALTNLLAREHNRKAAELTRKNPFWPDDVLFDFSREWVIGVWQNIIFNQFLPFLSRTRIPSYSGYNASVNPSIELHFLAAASRHGLAYLPNFYYNFQSNRDLSFTLQPISFAQTSFSNIAFKYFGLEAIIRNMIYTSPQSDKLGGLRDIKAAYPQIDVLAFTLQMGRDLGILPYDKLREFYKLKPLSAKNISNQRDIQIAFGRIYPNFSLVDSFIGALMEESGSMAPFGELLSSIAIEQLIRLRDGDRFYFLSESSGINPETRKEIQNYRLRDLIANNTKVTDIQQNLFAFSSLIFSEKPNYFRFSGRNYENFTCGFSVIWKVNVSHATFNICINERAGYYGIGFGNHGTIADYWFVQIDENNVVFDDYVFHEGHLSLDSDLGSSSNVLWTYKKDYNGCLHFVSAVRLRYTSDPHDVNITEDQGKNYTTLLWSYSYPFSTLKTFIPNENSSTTIYLFPNSVESTKLTVNYRYSYAYHLHGMTMLLIFGVLLPFSAFVAKFMSEDPSWLHLHSTINISCFFLLFLAIGTSWVASKKFDDIHAGVALIVVLSYLFAITTGIAHKNLFFSRRGMRILIRIFHIIAAYWTIFIGNINIIRGFYVLEIDQNVFPSAGFYSAWFVLVIALYFFRHKWLNEIWILAKVKEYALWIASFPRTYSKMCHHELQDRVTKGALYGIYQENIYVLKTNKQNFGNFLLLHPEDKMQVVALCGCDVTNLFNGIFGGISFCKKDFGFEFGKKSFDPKLKGKNPNQINICVHTKLARVHLAYSQVAHLTKCDDKTCAKLILQEKRNWTPPCFTCARDVSLNPHQRIIVVYGGKKMKYTSETQVVYKFKFLFQKATDVMCFLPGEYILLTLYDNYGHPVTRPYTPVTYLQEGAIDLYIKLYKNGEMSCLLDELSPGDYANIRGPIQGKSLLNPAIPIHGCENNILLLCAGSGITAGYQLIDYYFNFKRNTSNTNSNITLVYFSRNSNEIMMYEELEYLMAIGKGVLQIFHCFTRESWDGPQGHITPKLIHSTCSSMLSPQKNTQVFICGPDMFESEAKAVVGKIKS